MKEISAGGVVFRREGTTIQILLIQDHYSCWTLPKGKREPGETDEETALREIKEETGVEGRIQSFLETVQYQYFHSTYGDIDKTVHYYLVEACSDQVTPQLSEIDQVKWFSPDQAWKKQNSQGYDNNRSVMQKAFRELEIPGEWI